MTSDLCAVSFEEAPASPAVTTFVLVNKEQQLCGGMEREPFLPAVLNKSKGNWQGDHKPGDAPRGLQELWSREAHSSQRRHYNE